LLVDAIPAPQPLPEPFFGLGLLGRLLAAYSQSGVKEEDFGNCKCNRRTFHEKEKDKECLCDTYGAPISYNAPTNSYDAPIDDYGAPLAPVYSAPEASYGAPASGCDCKCNRRTFHIKGKEKEKEKECNCDCGYGAPSYDYQPPSIGYDAPVDSYGAPIQSYSEPYDSYGAPETGYGVPDSGYGFPSSGYGAPSSVCACDRSFSDRTFGNHKNKENEKEKGCDCSGYPTYDYGAPSVSYDPPSYTVPSYNPPCAYRRTFGPNKNKEKNPCTLYYRL